MAGHTGKRRWINTLTTILLFGFLDLLAGFKELELRVIEKIHPEGIKHYKQGLFSLSPSIRLILDMYAYIFFFAVNGRYEVVIESR